MRLDLFLSSNLHDMSNMFQALGNRHSLDEMMLRFYMIS